MTPAHSDLIRRIASVVGHELRNPLAVIKNSAYFVKAKLGGAGDAKVAKHLGIIESEIARADKILSEISAFSKPLELNVKPENLNAVVLAAVAAVQRPASVKMEKKFAKAPPEVKIDAAAVQDAVRRILENAVEAMPDGGVITVTTGLKGSWASVIVCDRGPGLDAKTLPSAAEPFVTTKPRGLGLGLSFAAKAARAHGGRLEIANVPGGAAVSVLLPA